MPLIVKGDARFAASYNGLNSPQEDFPPTPEPTEITPLNPSRAQDRQFRKSLIRKLKRKLKMRRFPISCLILAEVCERFAYYGIIINFVLFLDNFGWSMFASAGGVLVYTGVAWFMCALGGLVADSRFGRHSTIVSGLLVYFIGTVLLVCIAVWLDYRQQNMDDPGNLPILPWLVLIMLSIAAGEGAVKSNLSTFSAEQFHGESPSCAWKGLFTCFYWVSNVLALFGLAVVTYIQQSRLSWSSGFTLGFAIPVVSLTVAAAAFLSSSKYYVIDGPHGTGLRNVWLIIRQAWNKRKDRIETWELPSTRAVMSSQEKIRWLDKASVQYGGTFLKSEVHETRALGKAFIFSLCLIPYWMIYSQLYTTFILQGLHLMADFGGVIIPAAWMSLLEIAVILVLIPIMERAVYPECANCDIIVPRLWRVVFGILLAIASVGMAGYVELSKSEHFIHNGYVNQTTSCKVYKVVSGVTILWQIPQYILLGISEVFASMSGLELIYSLCPNTPQSVTSAVFNIAISIGSFLSFVIMGIVSVYHWYPSHMEDDLHYLQNHKVAWYYWLLGGIAMFGIFVLITVGYCCDIGVRRTSDHHHHVFVNEEDEGVIPPVPNVSSEGDFSPAEQPDHFETL